VLRAEYNCLDGSPFPVMFADPGDVGLRWVIDREHAPTAMTPLADSVRRVGRPGAELAYAESGVQMPSTLLRKPPLAHGYDYYVDDSLPQAERDEFGEGLARLAERYGGTLGVWLSHSLPRVREACSWLQAASPDMTFEALAEWRAYVWSHTSVAGVVARRDLRAVAASCEGIFGDRATLIAYALAQGFENETISADVALWHIASAEPDSPEATTALDQFLATYGSRATSWSIDHPTSLERPDLLDTQLRLLRRHRRSDFDDVRPDAADRRRKLAADIEARLRKGDEQARFQRRLARLEAFVPVREARARWQLVASGALRGAVQARGRLLVEHGVIDEIDDVFFLTPGEYDEPTDELRSAVAARRADHERWMAVTPPVVIGNTGPDQVPAMDGVVRGASGAPGVVTGPARVILDLMDADRLEPGDILVTTMTSPPWTPLLGIAAAVVTDAGDALSHVAIAAREYGIPCVVGTNYATLLVRDGTSVTVDGDAGTVRLQAEPQ
jgi:phosphohistidine swiveling domain-containing protein